MPTIPIRWSDNTKDLAANLKQGLNQIEATRAAAEKMAKSLGGDNLIRAAHNYAAAVEKIGGASALTEANQARVNAVLTKAIDQYQRLGQTAPQALIDLANATKQVEQPTSRLSGFLGDFNSQVLATATGMIGAQAALSAVSSGVRILTGFVTDSIKSYSAAEASQQKLTTALKAQGLATPAVIAQYGELSSTFQRTTKYSDDLVTEMQALLVQVGNVMPSQMGRALTAATDLASGLGIDLEQATTLVAKAAAGHTETLGRYGIVVDQAAFKTHGLDAVLDQVNKQFGGQAAAQLDTYAGRVEKLANDWDNVKEAVGKAVVNDPILVRGLRDVSEWAQKAGDSNFNLTGALKSLLNLTVSGSAIADLISQYEHLSDEANKAATTQREVAAALALAKPAVSHQTQTEADEAAVRARLAQAERQKKINDELAKSADEYRKALEAVNAKIREAEAPVQSLTEAQQKLILHFKELGLSNEEIALKMRVSRTTVDDLTKSTTEAATAIKSLKDSALVGAIPGLRVYDPQKDIEALQQFYEKLKSIENGTYRVKIDPAILQGPIPGVAVVNPDTFKPLAAGLRTSLMGVFKDLPTTVASAFAGGGGALGAAKSLGSQFGSVIGSSVGTSFAMAGKAVGTTLTGLSSLAGPVGAAIGSLVGPLIDKLVNIGGPSKQELAGRDVVANFEKRFGSVEEMINKVGAAYVANGKSAGDAQAAIQRLWAAEKQGADATKRALAEINAELEHHQQVTDAIHAEGFESHSELVAKAQTAKDVWEEMSKAVGEYTDAQIADAYAKWQEALAATGDAAAKAWVEAHQKAAAASSAAMSAVEKDINDMLQRRGELEKRVGAETKEEVIGENEKADRLELDRLDQQLQEKADQYAKLARDTGQEMAKAIVDALHDLHIDPVYVPVIVQKPEGPERDTPHGDGRPNSDGGGDDHPGAMFGGIVGRGGRLQHFDRSGIVRPMSSSWLHGPGTDTELVWTTPGELILNEGHQGRIAEALHNSLALMQASQSTGGGGEPSVVHVETHFHGPVLAERRYIHDVVVPEIFEGLKNGGKNYGTFREMTREATR